VTAAVGHCPRGRLPPQKSGKARFMTNLFKKWLNQSKAEAAAQPAPAAKRSVLIVDDDQSFLLAISGLMQDQGYEVLTVSSGKQGIDLMRRRAQKEPIDAVVLDYAMPGLNGLETLRAMRELGQSFKAIGMTGFGMFDLPPSFGKETELLLQKPFQTQELVQALDKLLPRPAVAPATPVPA
jgi:CheY-like chemotaxis protein